MLEEYFQEVGLTLVELPIEFLDDRLIYRGYIKELPMINAEGETRKAMQQKIAGIYQMYREQLLAESAEEEKEKRWTCPWMSCFVIMMAKHLTDFRFLTKRKQIYQAAGRKTPFIWKKGL